MKCPFVAKEIIGISSELVVVDPTIAQCRNVTMTCSKFISIKKWFRDTLDKIESIRKQVIANFEPQKEYSLKDISNFTKDPQFLLSALIASANYKKTN